jgi:bacteriocin biosynthesis cyclodehydratase domain-containing protein
VGRIGPLVVPGRTACLHCVDHHRTDRDPDWPTLLAQLLDSVPRPAPAVLAATAAALAVTQTCTFLATTTAATVDGQLVTRHAEVEVRRRTLPPHPRCGCSWRGTIAS